MEKSLIQRMGLSDRGFRCEVHIAMTARKAVPTQPPREVSGRPCRADFEPSETADFCKQRGFIMGHVIGIFADGNLPDIANGNVSRGFRCAIHIAITARKAFFS